MTSPDDLSDLSDLPNIEARDYFVLGKNRIKITEHFDPNGKTIGDIITELIIAKSREIVTKIA